MKLVHKKSRVEVKVGDTVTDFRGNSTGRVYAGAGAFFPSVYNLEWTVEGDQ